MQWELGVALWEHPALASEGLPELPAVRGLGKARGCTSGPETCPWARGREGVEGVEGVEGRACSAWGPQVGIQRISRGALGTQACCAGLSSIPISFFPKYFRDGKVLGG